MTTLKEAIEAGKELFKANQQKVALENALKAEQAQLELDSQVQACKLVLQTDGYFMSHVTNAVSKGERKFKLETRHGHAMVIAVLSVDNTLGAINKPGSAGANDVVTVTLPYPTDGSCCYNEKRSMDGGCETCGDPCL